MDVTHITSSVLRKLLSLSERKEALLKQIQAIESEIASVTFGGAAPAKASGSAKAAKAPKAPAGKAPKGRGRGKRGKRGALKDQILSILHAAGDSGARVKDIADKLGINAQNIHVWFSSTGKKIPGIKRLDAGLYKITGGSAPKAEAEPAKTPAKRAGRPKGKRTFKLKPKA
ncbi:MAG: hypothetical protein SFU53_08755 [Terrimicrobiaceae bacterium]|nr:hypothetical protein [Terrimicrobiaceae bacterium]